MLSRPTFHQDFANAPEWLHPRVAFTRASSGAYVTRTGLVAYRPANAPRFSFSPATGICNGLRLELSRTNLLLRSEDFADAAWTKTSCSVSSNSTAAPDGATTADTLTASGSGGNVSQAITITAGNSVALSCYLKASASNFGLLSIGDGSNTVNGWFNLSTGAIGTTGAGAGTVTLSSATITKQVNGFYRCFLGAVTNTSTSITCSVAPAAANGATPANTDAIYAWGADGEQIATAYPSVSSYIPTTSATATRGAETCSVLYDATIMSLTSGSLFAEIINRIPGTVAGVLFCAGSNAGNDYAAIRAQLLPGASTGTVDFAVVSGGVVQCDIIKTGVPMTADTPIKAAAAFAANDFALSVNGAAVLTDATGIVPAVFDKIGIGGYPATGVSLDATLRRCAYWPERISNSDLQTLTQ